MSEKSKNNVLFTTALVVVSAVVWLGVIEGILRVKNRAQNVYDIEMWKYSNQLKRRSSNPVLGHEHVPSTEATLQQTPIRINSVGLRGGPVPEVKNDQRRILIIGSSITLGWGVKEEETMTRRLQAMFENDGADVVVLNGGIGNYNSIRYVERALTKLTSIKPTDIVVHYFLNDVETLDPGGGNFFLRNSQLAITLWFVTNRIFKPSGKDVLLRHYQTLYRQDSREFRAMEASLRRLADYAQKNDIRLYLAMTPDIHNLIDYKFGFIHERMANLSDKLGYTYIDLLAGLNGIEPKKIWAMPGDPHPNKLGHKIMAETLYPILSKVR